MATKINFLKPREIQPSRQLRHSTPLTNQRLNYFSGFDLQQAPCTTGPQSMESYQKIDPLRSSSSRLLYEDFLGEVLNRLTCGQKGVSIT